MTQLINDIVRDRFEEAMKTENDINKSNAELVQPVVYESKIITTEEELQGLYIIKSIIHDKIDLNRITFKDYKTIFNIHIDDMVTKWICKLELPDDMNKQKKRYISINLPETSTNKIPINNIEELYNCKEDIIKALELLL